MSGPEQKARSVKKTRRGYKGKFSIQNKLRILGVNSNGISSKLSSLNYLIKELNPSIICLQETKLRKLGKLKSDNCKNYLTFELVRKHSHGGGLATMVKPELEPVWIAEGDDQVEILVSRSRFTGNSKNKSLKSFSKHICK